MENITTLGRKTSGSNTAAFGTRCWLQHGLALFALLITTFLVLPAHAQMDRLYLQHSQTNPGTGGIVRDLLPTQGPAGTVTSNNTNSTSFSERLAFTIDHADLPIAIGGTSFNVSVNVSNRSNSNLRARFRLQRTNSSGVVQTSSAYSAEFNTVGVKTATFTLPQDWAPGDRLRLSVEVRAYLFSTNRNITISTGNASSWVDYVPVNPCTGTPAPGNTMANVVNTCVDVPFILSLQNATPGDGVSYEWESSANGNTWGIIDGAELATLNTSQSAATWYRCLVTCNGNTGTSTPVQVLMDASANCYCAASSTNTSYERITRVAVGTIDHPSSANTGYEDHTAIMGDLVAGADNALTVQYGWVNAPNGYAENQVLIWIDLDGNGVFAVNELLYTSTLGQSPRTGTLTVPAGTPGITTRMRVRLHDTHNGSNYGNTPNATPCGNSTYGQVEDYTVTILPDVCNSLPAATATSTPVDCQTSTYMVTVDITDLNGAGSVDIVGTPGGVLASGVGTGQHVMGPFATGTFLDLMLAHPDGPLCDLDLGSHGTAQHCYLSGECHPDGFAIPDAGCGDDTVAELGLEFSGLPDALGSNVRFAHVDLVIEHRRRSDMHISLVSPTGQERDLFVRAPAPMATGEDLGNTDDCGADPFTLRDGGQPLSNLTSFGDQVIGSFAPEQALSGFTGDPNGTWTLRVCDAEAGQEGRVMMVNLRFETIDCMGVYAGSAWLGTPCTSSDPCLQNTVWDLECNCVGSPLPDSDGDGLCDAQDGCPNDPNKTAPGICGCGTPDTDTDGDGTPDCIDLCPLDPNKTAPGSCGCGNADPGTSCNDNDPNTVNDVVGADCICRGMPLDCSGVPNGPAMPGTPCDDNDPGTQNDTWGNDCQCTGTFNSCMDNELELVLSTDGNGSHTSWAIMRTNDNGVVCTGSGYGNNSTYTGDCCLPDGCYRLEVYDSFGDGMCCSNGQGGYVLRMADGRRIIDNSGDARFTSVSAIANGGDFCLPLGNVEITAERRDILDHAQTSWIRATAHGQVSAGLGMNNAGNGYQFWVFDADGSYSRRVLVTHATANPWFPAGPERASYLRLNSLTTNPIPQGIILNVRVRAMVNGVYEGFGPASRLRIGAPIEDCDVTMLIDDAQHPLYSCGVVRTFGGSDKVYAYPVNGANRYRFRFSDPGMGYVRNIANDVPAQVLGWSTNPLQQGRTYDVQVAISKDGGANWCAFGQACQVTIVAAPQTAGRSLQDAGITMLTSIWPNPNRGDLLNVRMEGIEAEHAVELDIRDLQGRLVMHKRLQPQADRLEQTITLPGSMAGGTYVVTITNNGQRITERLVVQ